MNLFKTASLLFITQLILAIPALSQPLTLPLWDGTPPFQTDMGLEELHERDGILRISNVQTPTLEVYLPDEEIATGKAVLLFPGGGYTILAYEWEGTEFAQWLRIDTNPVNVFSFRRDQFLLPVQAGCCL